MCKGIGQVPPIQGLPGRNRLEFGRRLDPFDAQEQPDCDRLWQTAHQTGVLEAVHPFGDPFL